MELRNVCIGHDIQFRTCCLKIINKGISEVAKFLFIFYNFPIFLASFCSPEANVILERFVCKNNTYNLIYLSPDCLQVFAIKLCACPAGRQGWLAPC